MSEGYQALTEREKATLRLIVRGHDAKSVARALGLSVHTINERLRDARRKLGVSSSREAARMVLELEGEGPQSLADTGLGEAAAPPDAAERNRKRPRRAAAAAAGAVVMILALSLAALVVLPQAGSSPAAPPNAAIADAAVTNAALQWLALVDAGRWHESWAATAASFRASNTSKVWADASEGGRVPLGAVRSRVFLSQESVPVTPAGAEVVKFRTSFAAKPDTVETLSLVREDGGWRVAGYIIG